MNKISCYCVTPTHLHGIPETALWSQALNERRSINGTGCCWVTICCDSWAMWTSTSEHAARVSDIGCWSLGQPILNESPLTVSGFGAKPVDNCSPLEKQLLLGSRL